MAIYIKELLSIKNKIYIIKYKLQLFDIHNKIINDK